MSFDVAFTQRNQWLKTEDQEEYNPLGQLQYIALKIPIAKNWGITILADDISKVKNENDFINLVSQYLSKINE